mmetsp:Transcript_20368/g.40696  ORF Transcript_20368/g.40696 Transcript_20368/m.40696 type:complete len:520 (-) Transcript_20368:158-1717(-)|eukprot:CAMPEP_0194341274 /NCGR_PEP_ID=MMETSP0171-20130528/89153_1 /TAXON_ID=218684 /ORGANISM="Corethron pennatum, Strain L29A3" /LENGTH=519 /DNA_ID=CAMNT_0039106549 /DNA_START=116 /DNA_END=1675 /DNA_ORIENTATION=-
MASEAAPLLPVAGDPSKHACKTTTAATATANEPETDEATSPSPIRQALGGILKGLESFLDWLPFIVAQSLSSSHPPATALGAGTLSAALVLLYAFGKASLEGTPKHRPKVLDIGQLLLFGTLYAIAVLLGGRRAALLVLWFNPLTTGGMAAIMWTSAAHGRPFVYDYAEAQMPPAVWTRLSTKEWFLRKLDEAAVFWVQTMVAMTAIVCVQPALVCIFYRGDVGADATGRMAALGNWLAASQYVILSYAIFSNAWEQGQSGRIKRRVQEMKRNGLSREQQKLHGDAPPELSILDEADAANIRHIRSLKADGELDLAGQMLADAFKNDGIFRDFLKTEEARTIFFCASLKAFACFNHVFACFDHEPSEEKPPCVMACIPVLSKTKEEISVFNAYEAWTEHGFAIPGATATDFPIPDDDLVELGELKHRSKHGLTKKPYIYIAYFGSDSAHRGKGYGKHLLKYIIRMSESKIIPLVLETTNAFNIAQYEKYGFRIVDRVKGKPEWVLMVRSFGQSSSGEVV